MRLLFVHEYLGAFGGAEASILLTAQGLKARGHAVSLAYRTETGKLSESWRDAFEDCVSIAENARQSLEAAVREFSPDAIFLNSLSDVSVQEDVFNLELPVLRMVHDHQLYCLRGSKYNFFTRKVCHRSASGHCIFPCLGFIQRGKSFPVCFTSYWSKRKEIRLNQRAAQVITYSEYNRRELVQNGFDREKVDLFAPVPCGSEQYRSPRMPDENLVLFAGQVIRGKGVDVLLRILTRISLPFRCVILGDGNHRAYCERLAKRLGLQERVQFTGFLPREASVNYYERATVLAITSLWPEPFGMVGPEAMLKGLPVVAFDVGGVCEWLEDGVTGWAVPVRNEAMFAERLQQLLLNKEKARQMGFRGWQRIRSLFHADHQIDRLEQLFQKITDTRQEKNEITDVHLVHGVY